MCVFAAGAAFLDSLPINFFRETARDTRVFATRLIGRRSNAVGALGVALLLAAAAAFAEEVAFRGVLFNVLNNWLGSAAALGASSLVFGVCHTLTFGPNALFESMFGAVFALVYILSGGNLAVPIAVHTLYDLFTLLLCWQLGTREFDEKVQRAKEQLDATKTQQPKKLPKQFDVFSRAVSIEDHALLHLSQ